MRRTRAPSWARLATWPRSRRGAARAASRRPPTPTRWAPSSTRHWRGSQAGGSVTRVLGRVRAGDPTASADATARLWARYFDALVRLARARLPQVARRAADEEDIALSAFDSFCRGEAAGRFSVLEDR